MSNRAPLTIGQRLVGTVTTINQWPSFHDCTRRLIAAEQSDGWLVECEEQDCYLLVCRELVEAISWLLDAADQMVEICSGRGEMAKALNQQGYSVVATDVQPAAEHVEGLSVQQALLRYRPQTVLASFPPIDAFIDEMIDQCPTVQQYLVFTADVNGMPNLTRSSQWTTQPLTAVSRWMVTRHDVWTQNSHRPILQHGRAWRLARKL